jgi:phage tail sheath protein FI
VISDVATSIAAFVGAPASGPVAVVSASDFVRTYTAGGVLGLAVRDFFRQGGGFAIVAGDVDQLLHAGALFNLLVVPGDPPADVTAAAVALAEERGALCILEPPAAWSTVDQAVAGASAPAFLRSPNAAMYFPRLAGPGPLRGPAGAVAGVIARSDVLRGVWAAPAGVEAALRWVEELSVPVSDAENGRLNSRGVNCLRNFAGAGPVVWGARTTADESDADWKYVNVRRLGLFLEQSLSRGLQWAVFEPNDEPLWGRIRAEAGAFLDDLFHRCAFVGTTPREAYFVKCDGDTTTQDDVDNGRINLVVGFAPSRPAEFVTLRIGLVAPTTTH